MHKHVFTCRDLTTSFSQLIAKELVQAINGISHTCIIEKEEKSQLGFFAFFCHAVHCIVLKLYLSNAVVSAKSPHSFTCTCSTEAVGIAHKPPCSL